MLTKLKTIGGRVLFCALFCTPFILGGLHGERQQRQWAKDRAEWSVNTVPVVVTDVRVVKQQKTIMDDSGDHSLAGMVIGGALGGPGGMILGGVAGESDGRPVGKMEEVASCRFTVIRPDGGKATFKTKNIDDMSGAPNVQRTNDCLALSVGDHIYIEDHTRTRDGRAIELRTTWQCRQTEPYWNCVESLGWIQ